MLGELIQQEIFATKGWMNYKEFTLKCSQVFKETFFEELESKYLVYANIGTETLSLERAKFHKYTKFKYPTGILLHFDDTAQSGYTIIPKVKYDD